MKIYIVTKGDYSDYHIEAVFESKKKAELYVKYHSSWDEPRIEEWDTDDESYDVSEQEYVRATTTFEVYETEKGFDRDVWYYDASYVDCAGKDITEVKIDNNDNGMVVSLVRYYKEEKELDFYKDKIAKIGDDFYAAIKALLIIEDYDFEDITEMLNNKKMD